MRADARVRRLEVHTAPACECGAATIERVILFGAAPIPEPSRCPKCGHTPALLFVRRYLIDREADCASRI